MPSAFTRSGSMFPLTQAKLYRLPTASRQTYRESRAAIVNDFNMPWYQREIQLTHRPYGIHLVTQEIAGQLPELAQVTVGLVHLHLLHTSAALGLNEAVEPEVRTDIESFLDQMAPEDSRRYTHNYEGPDDMPAHIKSLLVGPSLTLPVQQGSIVLGMWQGIYLCEFRRRASARRLMATIHGERTVDAEKE